MMSTTGFETVVHGKDVPHNGPIGHSNLKKFLRHRHPMIGVDQVVKHDFKAGWLHAARAISCSHPAFEGHFEDAAIYPGTNLTQDIIQLGIILFLGSTRELRGEGPDQEMTAVSNLSINLGHPVPPGVVLDVALWRTAGRGIHAIHFDFEARIRDFPYYEKQNELGIMFRSAISGSAELIRVKRKIYTGIGF